MEFLRRLDHPILFLIFLLLALKGTEAVITWGAKAANLPGLASLIQHP
jgi:hypothetical protein